ncbi:U3 small nucleolar RNA-associated protein 6 homolog [Amia ocellicauda]|uniref:U3 small nucleolar RNA-associated protein 6 homolog n=1 Tax=Amia ocellicauda TaxID=2972642 RepID=UPI003463AC5E
MAEIIQQRIEDRIPELEQLERVGLFTKKEVKAMIKKATALEYKLHRRIICKEDFITYIQYEINALELIKKRRTRTGYSFKKDEIEFSIVHRIHNVFKRATGKWKDDVQLWLSHIAFLKKWNTKIKLSKVFSSMLAIHPEKPALWLMAAKWEMEDCGSSESARHLFLRALRFHPDNSKVYQEYFRMELMHAEKLRKQKLQLEQANIDLGEYKFSEEIVSGKLAEVVYRDATQKIPGAQFMLSLLTVARLFDFTQELQQTILQDLQCAHANDPMTWDFLARRELEAGPETGAESVSAQSRAAAAAHREERSCQVYEQAVARLATGVMWTCYVSFCQERFLRKTNNQDLKDKRQERLLSVFQRAHDASLLEEPLYKKWLQVLQSLGRTQAAEEVALAATRSFSRSVETWCASLSVLLELGAAGIGAAFEEALSLLNPKESLPVWRLRVAWSESHQSAEETAALYQKGLLSPVASVSVEVKERFLDWSYRSGGYKQARRAFVSLHESRPFSKEFFSTMIRIEREQEPPRMERLRDCYERALREFGSGDAELWLEYIREELQQPQGRPENCGKLHWRALRSLEGEDVDRFITQYTLLQTGHL